MTGIEIRDLEPSDAEACDEIVLSLPYHFGREGGRRDCATAVRSEPGLVAVVAGEVLGFLTYARWFETSAEITWLAVRNERRRTGVGGALVETISQRLVVEGRRLLVVLTVSPSDPGPEPADGYQSTRAFYRKAGFELARDLAGLWDGGDTPVLMVKRLGNASSAV